MTDVPPAPPLEVGELSAPLEAARTARGGVFLGLAMGIGNVLSYCFVLILTHAFDPASFGAYSALNTVGIVLVIPAGAFQVVIAGRWNDAAERTSGLLAAAGTGLVLTALTAGLSPGLSDVLHLGGPTPALGMALMLLPMTLTGAFQGILLGSDRLDRLAWLYIITAGTRLLAAVTCAGLHATVTQVFLATAAASVAAAAFGWWASRSELAATSRHSGSLLAEMARSNLTLAAFTALTNVDVVLVRHFLDAHTSGGYGLASTFGRAMCWGTQFIALLVVPRLAHGHGVLWRAAGLITGVGAAATLVAALCSRQIVGIVGGPGFASYGTLMVACIGLGTLWALAQLLLFSEMAGNSAALGALTWTMVIVELVLGWTCVHGSTFAIIALAAACSGTVVLAGAWRLWATTHRA